MTAKRKSISKNAVRNYWKSRVMRGGAGLPVSVVDAIMSDSDGVKICWCCEKRGYQESCHIIPHSLGGSGDPENIFLMCSECHRTSPDTPDSSPFFEFVSQRAGAHHDMEVRFLREALARVTDAVANGCDIAVIEADLVESLGRGYKSAALHGSDMSSSTIEWVLRSSLDSALTAAADNKE